MRSRALLPVLLGLALTGCSSDDAPDDAALPSTPASAAVSASAAPTTSAGAGPQRSSSGVPSSPAVPSAAASAQPRRSASAASVRGTAAGDYTYDASGTYSLGGAPQQADGTSTLTVTPLRDGRQSSTLHTEEGGDTVQDVVVRTDGVYLARLALGTPINKQFRPASPVLLFPTPATVGKRWSWKATSTDGKSTISTTNHVVRTESLTIGGQQVATVVLQTQLVISGDVAYTADVTTWVAPDYQLPVKDHTKGRGTWGSLAFSTDVTSVMRSVRPS